MRLVVLGPGAAGKSTFAAALAEVTGMPLVELDQVFWTADLEPMPRERWAIVQQELTGPDAWILDGDLGPHDEPEVRLRRADTVVLFDLAPWRCVWRAARRSRERLDFWSWLLTWRIRYRPRILAAIAAEAAEADVIVVRRPTDVARALERLGGRDGRPGARNARPGASRPRPPRSEPPCRSRR